MSLKFAFITILFCTACSVLWAHEEHRTQLARLDTAIAAAPEQGDLYLRRASLLLKLDHPDKALETLRQGHAYVSHLSHFDLIQGRALLAAGKIEDALTALGKFHQKHADSHSGALAYARALKVAERFDESVEVFAALIEGADHPSPDLYRECVQAMDAAGSEKEATALLEHGLTQLGPLATLQLTLVDRYVAQGAHDKAIIVLDEMIAGNTRHDAYLLRKAQVLWNAGQKVAARGTCRRAVLCIDALPVRHRETDYTRRTRAALLVLLEDSQ